MKKEICIIGLGKMGAGLAEQLLEKDWKVFGMNRSQEVVQRLQQQGLEPIEQLEDVLQKMSAPRLVWVMLPSGDVVKEFLVGEKGLAYMLEAGDMVIDGGNTHYIETIKHADVFTERQIQFMDVGVSGGPSGARNGACLMIGGPKKLFTALEELFRDLALPNGYAHFEGAGAGHFVKMVHNGIEYGMMQAIAEGFNVMKESDFHLNLEEVARLYNTGSVVQSSLIGWMERAFQEWGQELKSISGEVSASGEAKWTIEAAKEKKLPITVIEESLKFREASKGNPSYTGKLVSALRGQFGGHPVMNDSSKE